MPPPKAAARKPPRKTTEWLDADAATRLLDVSRATLYAYVSRGFVRSEPTAGRPRERRYAREDVERLRTPCRGAAQSGESRGACAALGCAHPGVGDHAHRGRQAVLPRAGRRASWRARARSKKWRP